MATVHNKRRRHYQQHKIMIAISTVIGRTNGTNSASDNGTWVLSKPNELTAT